MERLYILSMAHTVKSFLFGLNAHINYDVELSLTYKMDNWIRDCHCMLELRLNVKKPRCNDMIYSK